MSDETPKNIPIKNLRQEDGASELATSPDMQPYLRLIKAGLQDQDTNPHMEEIAKLPLEKRYAWRVASALKWAFEVDPKGWTKKRRFLDRSAG